MRRGERDAGQAFPIYVMAIAGLLFLALAFFAVGQAAGSRNEAQTAADAAALAAGQAYRDQLRTDLLDVIRQGGSVKDLLGGFDGATDGACQDARYYAGRNGADATCGPEFGPTHFTVRVTARRAVGHSVIPATSKDHASADATSVVRPRCTAGDDPGAGGGADDGKGDGKGDDGKTALKLLCDGHPLDVDLRDLTLFPSASDLFTVQLTH